MTDNANMAALLDAALVRHGAIPAFELSDGTMVWRQDLQRQAGHMAGALAAAGAGPGHRILVQADKSVAAVALYLATLRIGAVYNPLNTAYTATEVNYFLSDAEPMVVIAPAAKLGSIASVARQHGARALLTLEADGSGSLADAARGAAAFDDAVIREPDDLAVLIYTSGTTGRSKGAMITHGNLAFVARGLIEHWQLRQGEVLIHALPLTHVHGLSISLNPGLLGGMKMLWREKFESGRVLADLGHAQVMMGVPTFNTRLLAEPGLTAQASGGMRLFMSGSAPLLPETHTEFHARTGHTILERYGMTETGVIASNPYNGERIAGSVGFALPGVSVRIADDRGRELARGDTGMVEVRGPNVFKGYWRLPEKTREEFRDDGFFVTGDQGAMAPDGRLTLVGRAKDLIITGGLNVYPIEVEQALNALPGISESAVIGVPHADFGEGVVAVVTAAGVEPPHEAAIIAALAERLAKFKCPKRVIVVAELPRNAMGKVTKASLRAKYKDLLV